MSLQRRIGLGITLGVDPAGGNNFTTIASIVSDITGSGVSADVAEVTILSDTVKQKVPGQVDAGDLSFEIAYDPAYQDTETIIDALLTTVPNYTAANFQISYPSVAANTSTTTNFLGFFTKMGFAAKKKDLLVAPVTVTASGKNGAGNQATPLGHQ